MRKTLFATALSLALASTGALATGDTVTHYTAGSSGSITQETSVNAGSISGAYTTGNGYASTNGSATMGANTGGYSVHAPSYAAVKGATAVEGQTTSSTFVLGNGEAGSVAFGNAEAKLEAKADFEKGSHDHQQYCLWNHCVLGPAYNEQTEKEGDVSLELKAKGGSYSDTYSDGTGGGYSKNGFEAAAVGKAVADVDKTYRHGVKVVSTGSWVDLATKAKTYSKNKDWGNGVAEGEAGAFAKALGDASAEANYPGHEIREPHYTPTNPKCNNGFGNGPDCAPPGHVKNGGGAHPGQDEQGS